MAGPNFGHVNFEAWCAHCVGERAKDEPHENAEKTQGTKDVVQTDYMYLSTRADGELIRKKAVICAVDEEGEGMASEVYAKGNADLYAEKQLEAYLTRTGRIGGVILQHDPEDAIGVMCRALAKKVPGVEARETRRKSHA